MKINYFNVAWFSRSDGPGLRTVLYLQRCNLRCPWCHSPHSREIESPLLFSSARCKNCNICVSVCKRNVHSIIDGVHTLDRNNCVKCGKCIDECPVSGRESNSGALCLPTKSMDSKELFNELLPQLEMYRRDGGLTISGGEALLQKEAVHEILRLCKSRGIHTTVETSLCVPLETLKSVGWYVDCWLIGIRGAYLPKAEGMEKQIEENIKYLSELSKDKYDDKYGIAFRTEYQDNKGRKLLYEDVIVRFPVIKGYTQSEQQLQKVAGYMRKGHFRYIEILPCNKEMLHYYTLSGITPEIVVEDAIPSEAEINSVVSFFESQGFVTSLIN